ncbi:MAG: peptidylprolyl isomerase [bacterium]|nr:peptidylprolyl isomerase [bacterium]
MKNIKLAALLAACAVSMAGCANPNSTVVTVGETKVSGKALDFYITELMNGGSSFDSYKQQAAENVENMFLMNEVGKALGFTLSEEEQDRVNSSLIRIRQQMGGKKEFDKTVKKYGVSEDFVKELLESSAYESKVMESLGDITPTDDEIKQYFTDNYLRAKHVLITTQDMTTGEEKDKEAAKATAEEVLAKAQAGEDFDALITQYNEDPGMSSNPNGYVFTDGEMVQAFEDKTKELQPGEIGICETDYGYHVIKKLALDETPELFESLFEENKSAATEAAEQAKLNNAVIEKAEEYNIKYEINEDALNNLTSLTTPEPEEE